MSGPMDEPQVVGLKPWLPWPLRSSVWWTEPVRAERLAALRIGLAVSLLLDILGIYMPYASDIFRMGSPQNVSSLPAPTLPWLLLRGVEDLMVWRIILIVWALAAASLLVGFCSRVSAALAWFIAISVANANLWARNSGDNVMVIILFYLMFCPSGAVWSVDRWLTRRRRKDLPSSSGLKESEILEAPSSTARGEVFVYPWALRLLFVQMCIIYFLNGLFKFTEGYWREGTALYIVTNGLAWTRWSPAELSMPIWMTKLLTYVTVIWELGFPVFVLIPRVRTVTLWIGVLFHVGTGISLMLAMFPFYMLCLYLPLVPWERYFDPKRQAN